MIQQSIDEQLAMIRGRFSSSQRLSLIYDGWALGSFCITVFTILSVNDDRPDWVWLTMIVLLVVVCVAAVTVIALDFRGLLSDEVNTAIRYKPLAEITNPVADLNNLAEQRDQAADQLEVAANQKKWCAIVAALACLTIVVLELLA